MESLRGERDQRDDLPSVAANQKGDTEPSEAWTRNLAVDGQETPDRREGESVDVLVQWMRKSISAVYRDKAKTKIRRKALAMPSVPSEADWHFVKVRANKSKAVNLEHRVIIFERQMAEAMAERTHPAKRHKRHHGGYVRLWYYFSTLTYRMLNDSHKAGRDTPDADVLAAAIVAYVERYASKFLQPRTQFPAKGYDRYARLDADDLDYLARTLARAVLRDWSGDYIEQKQREGSAGGSAPKKPRGLWADRSNLLQLQCWPTGATPISPSTSGVMPRRSSADGAGSNPATPDRRAPIPRTTP